MLKLAGCLLATCRRRMNMQMSICALEFHADEEPPTCGFSPGAIGVYGLFTIGLNFRLCSRRFSHHLSRMLLNGVGYFTAAMALPKAPRRRASFICSSVRATLPFFSMASTFVQRLACVKCICQRKLTKVN